MNYLGVHQTPDLLEDVWRELARERELARRIRAARAVRRAERPARFATLTAWLRRGDRPVPRPLPEGC